MLIKVGVYLDDINNKKESNTFEFATSNVLWRATLKIFRISCLLLNADYSGGIIIYDWYSENNLKRANKNISKIFK